MLQGRLYRGDAYSVAEQVLRDALLIQRDKLISDIASDSDLSQEKMIYWKAKAALLEKLADEVGQLVAETRPEYQEHLKKMKEKQEQNVRTR